MDRAADAPLADAGTTAGLAAAADRAGAPARPAAPVVVVMQPYLFPYLGYYQLLRAADHFVFLDDASFIKQGYINRNALLLDGQAHRFTVPVRDVSSFRAIGAHRYTGQWQPFLGLLAAAYRKAPQWSRAMPLIESVVCDADENVAHKNAQSVLRVFDYLGLPGRASCASALPPLPDAAGGAERVISLCVRHQAATYVNAPGGRALYEPAAFARRGIALRFLQSQPSPYPQRAPAFVPQLSMIDLLMHLPPAAIVEQLDRYALVS